MASITKKPPVPRFDWNGGQNPFTWIVAQAPRVRAAQEAQSQARWLEKEMDRRHGHKKAD